MATSQSTIDFLLDQLAEQGHFSARKMFGEYCLYLSGAPVGLVCDNQLFLRDDAGLRALMREVVLGEPYPSAKPHICITADQWDDRQALGMWVRAAVAARHAAAVAKASRPPKSPRAGGSKKGTSTQLAELPNLGPKSQQMLGAAGIRTTAQLRKLGAVRAFAQVKQHSPRASLNLLWALEGALTGLPWQTVAREHRTPLLLALEQVGTGK
jgi:DNA transformation protein